MPFVGEIFAQLKTAPDIQVLQEIRDGQFSGVTGPELLELVRKAPSRNGEFVSSSTIQPSARFCIHVPMFERKFPDQKKA